MKTNKHLAAFLFSLILCLHTAVIAQDVPAPGKLQFNSMEELAASLQKNAAQWYADGIKLGEGVAGAFDGYMKSGEPFVGFSASVGAGVGAGGGGQGGNAKGSIGVKGEITSTQNNEITVKLSEYVALSAEAGAVAHLEGKVSLSPSQTELTFKDNGNVLIRVSYGPEFGGSIEQGVGVGAIGFIGGGGSVAANVGYELEVPGDKLGQYLLLAMGSSSVIMGAQTFGLSTIIANEALLLSAVSDGIDIKPVAQVTVSTKESVGIKAKPELFAEIGGGVGASVSAGIKHTVLKVDLIDLYGTASSALAQGWQKATTIAGEWYNDAIERVVDTVFDDNTVSSGCFGDVTLVNGRVPTFLDGLGQIIDGIDNAKENIETIQEGIEAAREVEAIAKKLKAQFDAFDKFTAEIGKYTPVIDKIFKSVDIISKVCDVTTLLADGYTALATGDKDAFAEMINARVREAVVDISKNMGSVLGKLIGRVGGYAAGGGIASPLTGWVSGWLGGKAGEWLGEKVGGWAYDKFIAKWIEENISDVLFDMLCPSYGGGGEIDPGGPADPGSGDPNNPNNPTVPPGTGPGIEPPPPPEVPPPDIVILPTTPSLGKGNPTEGYNRGKELPTLERYTH